MVLAIVAPPLGAQLSPLVTDRPDFTESAVVVGRGTIQFEAGMTRTSSPPTAGAVVSAPELLVRLGLTERAEFRLGAPTWSKRVGASAGGDWDNRWSAGVKVEALSGGPTGLAFLGVASFQVGREDHILTAMEGGAPADLDDEEAIFSVLAVVSRELGGVGLAAMTSVTDGLATRLGQTLVASLPFGATVAGFLEYAGGFGGGLPAEHLAHAGAAWQLTPDLQVDLHGGRTLRGDRSWFIGAGISVRVR
jgi:hypothetical protein